MKKCIFAVFVCAVTTVLILSGCVFSKNPSPTPAGNADNSSASQQTSSAAESTDKTESEENSQPEQAVINRQTTAPILRAVMPNSPPLRENRESFFIIALRFCPIRKKIITTKF